MFKTPVFKPSLLLLGLLISLAACAQTDAQKLCAILKIAALPPNTTIQSCGPMTRDGGPMWDCIVQTNPNDLRVLLSGHSFRSLNTPAPEEVYLAQPQNFGNADWIHVLYNSTTGKAAIATHAP